MLAFPLLSDSLFCALHFMPHRISGQIVCLSHGLAASAISVTSFAIASQGKMADTMGFSAE
jgi:hypothetical protein